MCNENKSRVDVLVNQISYAVCTEECSLYFLRADFWTKNIEWVKQDSLAPITDDSHN